MRLFSTESYSESSCNRRKPCTGFCPNGWNTYDGEFAWNAKAFPDPKRMIQELQAEHFNFVLHFDGRPVEVRLR